jgi:hypothetical protein
MNSSQNVLSAYPTLPHGKELAILARVLQNGDQFVLLAVVIARSDKGIFRKRFGSYILQPEVSL